MLILGEANGADIRVVAFMQYLRVVCVTFIASLVAHWWTGGQVSPIAADAVGTVASPILAAPSSWRLAVLTLAVAVGGAFIGQRLRIPAGALLLPMFAGIAIQDFGGMKMELPPLVLAVAYAAIGWVVGSRFNREVLLSTWRWTPRILASTLALIALCGCFSIGLVRWAGVDPLTAYLAMSPGGADTVAIIAASTPVDVPFVITMQVLRVLFVIATGPAIARMIIRTMGYPQPRG